ncbi:isochorismate synthase [Saccharopolyspora lacisalsi]|uniref:isochorismate synthase n=1 Tax=Halosaccharopolyspora lacisalsi TaxID=1000566 RepID=A0A839DTR0_9PSEU|nr:isochorismate synthase DhbC [Halosaccharopolyspora lacisalsi]MBA8824423.1 isochorismate synthase [Halosaccharopolyspora lacisalsi]
MTIDSDPTGLDTLVATDEAARLLQAYEPGSSFFLSSPRGTMLARGAEATVPRTGTRADLPARVAEFLRDAEGFGRGNPMVVGAVPFADSLPAHLVLPDEVIHASPLDVLAPATESEEVDCAVRAVPPPEEYERGVERVLRRIGDGELDKAVLARSLELSTPDPINPSRMLRNLALRDPSGYTFAVDLPRRDADGAGDPSVPGSGFGRTLLGASPELLVSRSGFLVRANPLAGSLPRSDDPTEDRARAQRLLNSDKDRREHSVVIESVAAALRPLCSDLHVPAEPTVTATATMWHLSTEITGTVRDQRTSSLHLATALHPTPAVCGAPVRAAGSAIAEVEPFERGYYTGMVGWCDAAGDGEWVVAIRCGEVEDNSLRLFAGAGIVDGSDPAAELAETSAKFRTALAAMGWQHRI